MSTNSYRSGRACAHVSHLALPLLSLAVGAALAACSANGNDPHPANTGGSNVNAGGSAAGGGVTSGGMPTAGAAGDPNVAQGINLAGQPKYYRVVRLTNEQWAKSVQAVLKLTEPSALAAAFQSSVSGAREFSNNELLLDMSERAYDDFQAAAETLAAQVTATDAALTAVYAGTDAAGFIKAVGRRAFRRPLTDAEVTKYGALFDKGSAMSGTKSTFAKGAALVLRSFLQSPYFLYRTELSPTGMPLSGYEVAAKLSLWLRGASPNDALLDTAPTLTTPEAVAAEATALLGEPSAPQVLREFYRELFHLDRYAQLSKPLVPTYSEAINPELQESSYLFFDKLLKEGLGVRELLTSTRGFVGPQMAPLYGLASAGSGYVEQDLGPKRAGYFSQLPYLMLNAFDKEPDSIHRGVNLNLDVLCAPLGPPDVVPPLPPLQPGQTNRQRIDTLTSGCGRECHNQMINPIGFAFEHFDGMGQYQDTENGGLTIDSKGSYAFSEGVQSYADNVALMAIMAESEQAHLCYAKKLAGFGLQRDIVVSDLPWLKGVANVSKVDKGSIKQIAIAITKSDAFRTHLGGTQ